MRDSTLLSRLPWSLPITWFDRVGYYEIDGPIGARIVSISLADSHVQGTYDAFWAKLIDKSGGVVTAKTFLFRDYLKLRFQQANAKDVSLWYHPHGEDLQWYLCAPESAQPITQAIEKWISFFCLKGDE